MKLVVSLKRTRVWVASVLVVSALLLFTAVGSPQSGTPAVTIISPTTQSPVQTNLVSDIPGLAVTTDPNLINPWGISNSATSPYWISDQGTGKSTLYNGAGTRTNAIVAVPAIGIPSGPTGTVFNSTTGFLVGSTAANFIFATLDGTIAAGTGINARVTEATLPGAVFTGLALANNGTANYLYAADFVTGGTIQIFDTNFHSTTLAASFTDASLPVGYAPYNIQPLNGNLYVAYAEIGVRGAATGAGLGLIDIFDTNGNFLQRLITGGALNAPWGMTIAPAGFMTFGNDLLVGNFGNGEINAYNPTTGAFVGTITDPAGNPLVNSGLWMLEFGNGNTGSSPTTLYFTAGINAETDGLFGAITPGPVTLTFPSQLTGTTSASQTVTIENTGTASLTLSSAPAVTGTNNTDFAITSGSTCTNGATVAQGASCTIIVTFTPAAIGARGPATLSISDNASTSPQTLVLSGTGAAGTPAVTFSGTPPLTFAGQLVSTTSAAQTVTVTNSGSASLTFGASAVGISNDFTQTNTCNGATMAINGTCTIAVTFVPSSTVNDPRTGTLTLADNAANSPQTLALSGTAWDFSLTVPATMAATAGTPASIPVTVNALGGFTGAVTLTCTGTIPQGSCTAPTSPITAPGSTTVMVTSTAFLPPMPRWRIPPISTRPILILLVFILLVASLVARRKSRRLVLAGALVICLVVAGCTNSSTTAAPITPAGSYAFTITGTSGGVSHSASVTVTVN